MAPSLRRGLERSPRDARQLDLNFCFGEFRSISSEGRDSNMNDVVDGIHETPVSKRLWTIR